ncbi:MAG: ribokinase [Cyclobacteriaceae bacterium]|nr:ribokinase [Cyclobacteriaceae bacterium]
MSVPIYVVGSSNTDMVVKAEKLPSPGETVIGGSFLMNPGGKGANQAVAASRLGGRVTFVACVGNDIFGQHALEQFQKEKINTDFIVISSDHPSGVALINVDEKGENCIAVAPGANGQLSTTMVEQALTLIDGPAILLLQLEIPLETVEYAIEYGHKKNVKVILNPAPANKLSDSVFRDIFLITPNESEAELLTGIRVTNLESAEIAGEKLHEKGVRNVVITLGAKGAYLSSETTRKVIEGPKVTAIDTTAAGDCFSGALAVALSEDQPLEQAVAFACKAASISVTRMGAQSSLPYRKEIGSVA